MTLEVADIDGAVEVLSEVGYRTVDYQTYDDWTEVFVSPSNPTGTLFQLMEYHDFYAENRETDDAGLFVRGDPL